MSRLGQHPLRAALDILVDQRADISEHEAAYIKAEKLGRVSGAELETDVRGRRVLEARVLNLARDLICGERVVSRCVYVCFCVVQ